MKHIAEHYTELEGILCEVGDGLDPVWRIGHRSLDLEELIGRRVRVIVEVLEEGGADMTKRTRTESRVFWLSRDNANPRLYKLLFRKPGARCIDPFAVWHKYPLNFDEAACVLLKPGEAAKFKLVRVKEGKK